MICTCLLTTQVCFVLHINRNYYGCPVHTYFLVNVPSPKKAVNTISSKKTQPTALNSPKHDSNTALLVGGLVAINFIFPLILAINFIFPLILGISSSQMTNSIIFQRGGPGPPTQPCCALLPPLRSTHRFPMGRSLQRERQKFTRCCGLDFMGRS